MWGKNGKLAWQISHSTSPQKSTHQNNESTVPVMIFTEVSPTVFYHSDFKSENYPRRQLVQESFPFQRFKSKSRQKDLPGDHMVKCHHRELNAVLPPPSSCLNYSTTI